MTRAHFCCDRDLTTCRFQGFFSKPNRFSLFYIRITPVLLSFFSLLNLSLSGLLCQYYLVNKFNRFLLLEPEQFTGKNDIYGGYMMECVSAGFCNDRGNDMANFNLACTKECITTISYSYRNKEHSLRRKKNNTYPP